MILSEENKSTLSKTKRDVSLVKKFLEVKGGKSLIEDIPAEILNDYLAEFVLVVKMVMTMSHLV